MKSRVSDVQIITVEPRGDLVAFANIIYDDNLFLGSIGIYTRLEGGYCLRYSKEGSEEGAGIFHPINRSTAKEIEDAVLAKYEEVITEVEKMRQAL